MDKENVPAQRSTELRRNNSQELKIKINQNNIKNIFLINGSAFITEGITKSDLIVKPNDYYMIINKGKTQINLKYNQTILNHAIIYDPFKNEKSPKSYLKSELLRLKYDIPEGYIDTLPKWYSFKFTYPQYNLIFVKPESGLSIQTHKQRNEFWEIVEGGPIIINGNKVSYFVENGTMFKNAIKTYHSIINPNKETNAFVIIKERWSGKFDEKDIERVFNPNHYG